MIDGPAGQGIAEPERGIDGDEAVIRPFQVGEDLEEWPERPADFAQRGIARHTETRDSPRCGAIPDHGPSGAAGDVEETTMLDPHRAQEPVDPARPDPRAIGQGRAEVGSADRREAQHAARPCRVRQQLAGIEPTHAVPDQVHGLARKGRVNLLAERLGAKLHARDRGDARLDDAVPARAEKLRDPAEVGGQGKPTPPDPPKAE
jgi:hypothetical protein